jgi:hypothetical protein
MREETTSKKNQTTRSIRTEQPMNRGNGSIHARESRRRLGRRPKAPRKDSPRATGKTSVEDFGDFAVRANASCIRTEGGLLYAALRVWELKHGFGD